MHRNLFLFLLLVGSCLANVQPVTINVAEKSTYPTLESVSRSFSENQKPETMFLGVTRRFKDATLDQIADASLPFFETRAANLSSLISQVLAISNLSQRVIKGENFDQAHRTQILRALATITATRELFLEYMENVPASSKILVPKDGKLCDIRGEINVIEQQCLLASRVLNGDAPRVTRVAAL